MSQKSLQRSGTKSKGDERPAVPALAYYPLERVADLWRVPTRRLADWLRAAGIAVGTAPGTTMKIVRLADFERLFQSAALPDETHVDTIMRVTSEPMTADDVLASVGLRRRRRSA